VKTIYLTIKVKCASVLFLLNLLGLGDVQNMKIMSKEDFQKFIDSALKDKVAHKIRSLEKTRFAITFIMMKEEKQMRGIQ